MPSSTSFLSCGPDGRRYRDRAWKKNSPLEKVVSRGHQGKRVVVLPRYFIEAPIINAGKGGPILLGHKKESRRRGERANDTCSQGFLNVIIHRHSLGGDREWQPQGGYFPHRSYMAQSYKKAGR